MSNRENPCAGYLIEAAKLAVFIPEDQRPAFHDALAEHDFEEAVKLLDQFIPDDVACPSADFHPQRHGHRRRGHGRRCSLCLFRRGRPVRAAREVGPDSTS